MAFSFSDFLRVAVTTGNINGIGLEVACKALSKLGPKRGVRFYLFRSLDCRKKNFSFIDKKFKRITCSSLEEGFSQEKSWEKSERCLVDIASSLSPPNWVYESTQACLKKKLQALVTGPLSKQSFYEAGYKQAGHTEAFKKWTRRKKLFMAFIGKKCSVLLATGHVPLFEVQKLLTASCLEKALLAAHSLKESLSKKERRPIGLIGVNPHAGENGLIGREEKVLLNKVIQKMEKRFSRSGSGPYFCGPLVPDVAFLPHHLKKYSILVSPYHDQGLVGFKTLHGYQSGVHITVGLPFVRTSVSHGTAFDISGQNKADSSSMLEALLTAIRLSRQSFARSF